MSDIWANRPKANRLNAARDRLLKLMDKAWKDEQLKFIDKQKQRSANASNGTVSRYSLRKFLLRSSRCGIFES